ncbi:cytochrome P450 [Dendrothele bispora CBS 962.96]|uniref:Cytochrome P450 n=1 Tax=Dendrothele bispora (strain CBS 962.96) TaxID=1314807 RepID=A0A4S8MM16_DENBC|nr:cytochrome P450 [Dendrothele bispora CBS 962.96]
MSLLLLFLLLLAPFLCHLFYPFLLLIYRQRRSPLRHLNGPPSRSWFLGNLIEMHDQENSFLIETWQDLYGSTFTYRGFVGGCRLMTTDPLAVAHILGNAYSYPKPDFVRDSLATMAAGHDGLLTSEGEQHRKQRKILTPAFTHSHIKSLTPIFWEKAEKLRDIWLDKGTLPLARVDALSWLGRATLDVIGLAGFGYHFDSLSQSSDELADAFSIIFSTARKFRVMTILQVWFPFFRRFRRNSKTMLQAQATMHRIGTDLIQRATAEVSEKPVNKDLLSVLVRSNSAAATQRMSTQEILCQISTFIAAGHETTASALTWCLYALSQSPHSQSTLRAALRAIPTSDSQSQLTEEILKCEYLDWVVRETLRVHAPITNTMRVCMKDGGDEIPVTSTSENGSLGGFTDRYGTRRSSIPVNKWDIISIPISAINRSSEVWGSDAKVFRPERWASPPSQANAIPGLYSNILTFLNGNPLDGNRACIGYKFALIE